MYKYLLKLKENTKQLGTLCSVIQGIVTGADKLTPKHISKYSLPFNAGAGIFVLSKNEELVLNLNENEKKLLKPWFKNSHISKWVTNENTSENLIYYSSKKKYQMIPNIKSHFIRFKPILINRNTRSGTGILTENDYDLFVKGEKFVSYVMIASAFKRGEYQCISYARDKHIFEGPKIVAPQRSNKNTFGYNEVPWYASADVYFITQVDKEIDLKYILSLLNSKLYYSWLYHKGKRKGETLELYQKPLAEIPIKKISLDEQKPFIKLVDQILTAKKANAQADTTALEAKIDKLVYQLYNLTIDEIAIIETTKEN